MIGGLRASEVGPVVPGLRTHLRACGVRASTLARLLTHTNSHTLCDLVIAANFPSHFSSPAETSEGAARGAAIPIVAPPVRRRCNRGGY